MDAEEIAENMRLVFSIIQKAVNDAKPPLDAIQRSRNIEQFSKAGKSFISGLRNFTGKTFETVIEAWIKANIK